MTARPDSLDELGDDTYCEVAQLSAASAEHSADLADIRADQAEVSADTAGVSADTACLCADRARINADSADHAARKAHREVHTMYTLACGTVFGFALAVLLYLAVSLLVRDLPPTTVPAHGYDTSEWTVPLPDTGPGAAAIPNP
jgi:hypothetical protein